MVPECQLLPSSLPPHLHCHCQNQQHQQLQQQQQHFHLDIQINIDSISTATVRISSSTSTQIYRQIQHKDSILTTTVCMQLRQKQTASHSQCSESLGSNPSGTESYKRFLKSSLLIISVTNFTWNKGSRKQHLTYFSHVEVSKFLNLNKQKNSIEIING